MEKRTLTNDSRVVATKEQVSTALGGKMAILHLKNGTYYSLDEVGSPIWEALQEEKRVSEVRDALLQKYPIDPDQCERDLLAFLQQLSDQDLIQVR